MGNLKMNLLCVCTPALLVHMLYFVPHPSFPFDMWRIGVFWHIKKSREDFSPHGCVYMWVDFYYQLVVILQGYYGYLYLSVVLTLEVGFVFQCNINQNTR